MKSLILFIVYFLGVIIVPLIVKRVDNNNPLPKGMVQYRPLGIALFIFQVLFIGVLVFPYFVYLSLRYHHFLPFVFGLVLFLVSGACSIWYASILKAKIIISPHRLVIEHAARLESGKVHVWNLGCYHLDLRWEEIKKLERDLNFLRIELHDGEEYIFPIGWCNKKAGIELTRHKQVKTWNRPRSFFI